MSVRPFISPYFPAKHLRPDPPGYLTFHKTCRVIQINSMESASVAVKYQFILHTMKSSSLFSVLFLSFFVMSSLRCAESCGCSSTRFIVDQS